MSYIVHDTVVSRGIGEERGQVTADGGRRAVENSSVGASGATAEERCRDNHQSTPGEPAGRAEGPFNCAQNLMQESSYMCMLHESDCEPTSNALIEAMTQISNAVCTTSPFLTYRLTPGMKSLTIEPWLIITILACN